MLEEINLTLYLSVFYYAAALYQAGLFLIDFGPLALRLTRDLNVYLALYLCMSLSDVDIDDLLEAASYSGPAALAHPVSATRPPAGIRPLASKPAVAAIAAKALSSPALKAASPALKTASPALKTASPALKTASPTLKTASPALKPTSPALKSALKPASPALKSVRGTKATEEAPEEGESGLIPKQEEFVLSDMIEHIKKKGMWAGALKPMAIPDLLGAVPCEGTELKVSLVNIGRTHTPAVLKAMDEILVNATDHWVTHVKSPPSQCVTYIDVEFDRLTGRVSVENDGPGIPVMVHEKATANHGRTVYVPEVAFAECLAGTNIEKPKNCVRGGINGLGAKIANIHSVVMDVETVDGASRTHYVQQFRNRLSERGAPVLTDLRKKHDLSVKAAKPHTKVSFIPAYDALGYDGPRRGKATPEAPGPLSPTDYGDIDAWLRLRTHQAAAYVGSKVAVRYNGVQCATSSAAGLARLLAGTPSTEDEAPAIVLSAQAKATEEPYSQYPWDVAVVVLPLGKKTGPRAAAQNMTIVNGVLSNKGTHVKHLKATFLTAIEDKVRRATKASAGKTTKGAKDTTAKEKENAVETKQISACIRLVMVGAIPGADWGGQRKDELQVPAKETVHWPTLPAIFLKRVADAVSERLLLERDGAGKKKKFVHDKYVPAKNAGTAKRAHTLLLAGEGDSALEMVKAGLTQKRKDVPPGGPSLDWCGRISLQGVVVNAARQVTEVKASDGATITVRSEKLKNNQRLLALEDAFGLRHGVAYNTAEELATLKYGQLVLCVDQDLDGTGKIAPLVLVWLYQFWPALFSAGRVARFVTPLVRVYPKKKGAKLMEFFYEEDLTRWLAENPDWPTTHEKPKYYKGLAGHSAEEVARMFEPLNFKAAIHTYTLDGVTKELFGVYFGNDPSLRKKALLTPVAYLSAAEVADLQKRRQIPLGRVQLSIDVKAYKNDAIKRQIPGAVDGLNPARRKILMGALLRFGGEAASKEIKVFQLGGAVADKLFYHHGDASLNGTIVYMAQGFRGARRYPFLTGVGQFGNMHGADAGSPRYIGVKLSPLVKVAFPPADRWHLEYVFEDGERAEPRTLVPVLPLAALETNHNVSEAWNHDSFGRRLESVLTVVRAYLAGDPDLVHAAQLLHDHGSAPAAMAEVRALEKKWPLPVESAGYAGEVRAYRGEQYSFGVYEWSPATNTVTVTDLPIGVNTAAYLKRLTGPGTGGKPNPRAGHILAVDDMSSESSVEIVVKLQKDAFDAIQEAFGDATIDPLEDFLQLRSSLRPHLNFYSARGGVLEFGESYLAPVLYWAHLRAALYVARLTREQVVASLRVLVETETLRYIEIAAEMDLARLDDEELAAEQLRARGFPPFDTGLLRAPEYTPNELLYALVTEGAGVSYNYIFGLTEGELLKKAATLRRKRLEGYKEDLARATACLSESPTPAASVWGAEIGHFLTLANKH
jgi:DNA topoisomerase-2